MDERSQKSAEERKISDKKRRHWDQKVRRKEWQWARMKSRHIVAAEKGRTRALHGTQETEKPSPSNIPRNNQKKKSALVNTKLLPLILTSQARARARNLSLFLFYFFLWECHDFFYFCFACLNFFVARPRSWKNRSHKVFLGMTWTNNERENATISVYITVIDA